MVKALTGVVVNACALAVAAWIFDGIRVGGRAMDTTDKVLQLAGVAVLFGIVNVVVAPLVRLLSLPLVILTLGLALIVINAVMLLLVSAIADAVGLAFSVDGFWTAFWAAIVISLVSAVLNLALYDWQ